MSTRLLCRRVVTASVVAGATPAAAQAAVPGAGRGRLRRPRRRASPAASGCRRCGCTIAPSARRARTPTAWSATRVLILHGTGGSGAGFLGAGYGGLLFGKGQLLDAERYYIILPDNVGHGRSSKPSDGLRMKFPAYRYTDMVRLQHRLVTEGLGLDPPAPGDGHLDGRDAQLDVGLHVSRLRRRPGAAGQQPGRDRRPQPGVAQGAGRRHRHRPDLEGRQLHRAAARHGQRAGLPADRHQHADAVAEAVPHRGGGRRLAGRPDRHPA